MAIRVYSPAGEPFDIPRRDLADKLILEQGWTQTAPVSAPVQEEEETAPTPKRRSRRKSKPVEEIEPDTVEEEVEEASEDDGAE